MHFDAEDVEIDVSDDILLQAFEITSEPLPSKSTSGYEKDLWNDLTLRTVKS